MDSFGWVRSVRVPCSLLSIQYYFNCKNFFPREYSGPSSICSIQLFNELHLAHLGPTSHFGCHQHLKPSSIQQSLARRWCPNRLSGDGSLLDGMLKRDETHATCRQHQKLHTQLITKCCQASFPAHRPHHWPQKFSVLG